MIDEQDRATQIQPLPETLTIKQLAETLTIKQLAETLQLSRNQTLYLLRKHKTPSVAKNARGFKLYTIEDFVLSTKS